MLAVRSLSASAGDLSHAGSISVRKNRWRRAWQPTPVFSPGESLVRGGWWATVHGVAKSWTRQKQSSMYVYAHVYAYMILWCENSMKVCIRSSSYPTTYGEGKQGGNKWGKKGEKHNKKSITHVILLLCWCEAIFICIYGILRKLIKTKRRSWERCLYYERHKKGWNVLSILFIYLFFIFIWKSMLIFFLIF